MKFTLPLPPSSNRYWRHTRNGQIYVSEPAREYKRTVKLLLGNRQRFEGEIEIDLKIYRERKAGDLDNRLKICLDALSKIVFADDKQIVKITAERFEDKRNPRVEVEVKQR